MSSDHIKLDVQSDGNIPTIQAQIDYKSEQSDLYNILKWNGQIAEEHKKENLNRLEGIKVDVR